MPRRVWIGGGSGGLGLECARVFAAAGERLAICGRDAARLASARATLEAAGAAEVHSLAADLATANGAAHFATAALEALRGCDVLVYAVAGGGPGGLRDHVDARFEADWAYAFQVNVMAPVRLARLAHGALVSSVTGGVIVHVASVWSREPMAETALSYGATKASLDYLTQALAQELGPTGVRVVGVAPGPVGDAAAEGGDAAEVAPNALRRVATPSEIARVVAWAAGPGASFVTGTTIIADGGYLRAVR